MMTSAQRRADIADARKLTRGSVLTYLIAAGDPRLAREPHLLAAIRHWTANVTLRRPT
jgi:hypothetical protein